MTSRDDRDYESVQNSVAKLLDGGLPEEAFAELAERLREDPGARAEYFDCVSLETGLEHVYALPLSRGGNGHGMQAAAVRKQARRALVDNVRVTACHR